MLRVFRVLGVPPEEYEQFLTDERQVADNVLRILLARARTFILSDDTQDALAEFERRFKRDAERYMPESATKTTSESKAA